MAPLPRKLQVEVTGSCNLRCRMCLVRYRPAIPKRAGALALEDYKALVDELPGLEELILQGLGEPLLSPHLFEMIEFARARGIEVGFNTNATLLTRPKARRLVDLDVAWLAISLDGASAAAYEDVRHGARYERVRANVEGLLAERRDGRPHVKLVFVAMRRNVAELPALVELADEWGVEEVSVQNLSHSFSDTDPAGDYAEIRAYAEREALWNGAGSPEAEAAFAEARALADRVGVTLRVPRLDEPARLRAPGDRGCEWPWDGAYVTHEGRVQPCCMVMGSDRATLGDLRTQRFTDVWNGERYAEFRRRLTSADPPAVCAGCSAYRHVF